MLLVVGIFKDSTELFQSLYVTQMIKAGRTLVEDAIIAEVRTNGFMVYVPRFGIRCPVHLRDKHGNIKFPKSAVTGDVKDVDVEIACDHIEFTETKAVVKLSPGSGYNVSQVTFCTFDHLRVMLRVHESRAHWNRIYTLMVSPASGSLVGKPLQKRLDAEELEASIRKLELAERRPIEETTAAAAMIATESKSAPVQQLSEMYSILEKFGSLMVRDASQPTSHV
ncbi:hypothetical protein EV182_005498 [Spiromyces aspiralis]|uniref:Uncharacterized protein n=1 Tax=Spiromyces aspiralis TaxID=68401 RepID=A0ACC1H9Z9_9FUNG|nr:hypothetical protein EV182_005498 [Spiromyces aspiralis]